MSGNLSRVGSGINSLNRQPSIAKNVSSVLEDYSSDAGSAVDGLIVERSSGSAIKAIPSQAAAEFDIDHHQEIYRQASFGQIEQEEEIQPFDVEQVDPTTHDVDLPGRMIVIPAGGLGKSKSAKSSPRKSSGRPRTPSGSVILDMTGRTNSRTAATPTRELDRLHMEARAPPRFICPCSGRIMRDPVILATGTTCDRGAFERYLAKGNKRCPVTKRPLRKPIHMMPNMELRNAIAAWAQKNAPWLLDNDGLLVPNEPDASELQGDDVQYVTPMEDEEPGANGLNRTPSRIQSGKSEWRFTNGSKVRPNASAYNLDARAGSGNINNDAAPWYNHRGIASVPRSKRSRSSRHRESSRSISPSKRVVKKRDWYSTGFLALITAAYLATFLVSLSKSQWAMVPMSINPWYGAGPNGLSDAGAQVLPLMEGPAKQWWRLLSTMFLPAGLIHFFLCVVGLWLYGRYAQMALPLPQVTVPLTYLLSSLLGSMASVNLNAQYVSCGAAAGVCGLLGVVCADQMFNFKTKKLFNLREWYLVALIMLVNVGVFITFSLLPMVDVWYAAAGLIAGFLGSVVLLLLPRVGKGKPNNAAWASTQIISAVLYIGIFTVAVVGCAMPSKLGENIQLLQSASCVQIKDNGWWHCAPYGVMPNGCKAVPGSDSTALLTCAGATSPITVPNVNAAQIGDYNTLLGLCSTYCQNAATAPAPADPAVVSTTTITVDAPAVAPSVDAAATTLVAGSVPAAADATTTTTTIPTTTIAAAPETSIPTTTITVPQTLPAGDVGRKLLREKRL